ncbi:MAG: hypothetical protein Q8P49_01635 [Candidatus Liptonbacteria bacterium]|nr:hypothetical protein [Candidatus Liptonbacteria bacterium]
MKGDITLRILETIGDMAISSADLIEAILLAGYGAPIGKIERETVRIGKRRKIMKSDLQTRQRYHMMLSRLKRDQLINMKRENSIKLFSLTKKGRGRLMVLREQNTLRISQPVYPLADSPTTIMVAFDIPETEKRKRDWIRAVLKSLNYSMVQKSLWIGKTKIPQEFLEDLVRLRLVDFVEIFEISKIGSLRNKT